MKTRVIAGLCMLPLLFILYWGSYPLVAAALFIAMVGVTEFYNGWEALGVKPCKPIAYVMTGILFLFHTAAMILNADHMIYVTFALMWVVVALGVSFLYGFKIDKRGAYDALVTALGLVYVVFFTYFMLLIDNIDHAKIWVVVLASFGSDIFAYFTGYLIGKHKLAPVLSPKKTIEGAVGGVIGAGVLCMVYGGIMDGWTAGVLIQMFIMGAIAGGVSQCGDLTASAFKRKMGIKDYGKLIPGHGGIMDRFDSIIFTAPFVYIIVMVPNILVGMYIFQ